MSSSLRILLTNALAVAFVTLMPVNSHANFKSFEPLPFVMMMYMQREEFCNFDRTTKEQSFKKDGIIKNLLLILSILFCLSWGKASHCSPGWPWSSCLTALAFWVPRWQAHDTIRGSRVYYSIGVYLATYSTYAKYSFILIFASFEWAFTTVTQLLGYGWLAFLLCFVS